MTSIPDPVTLGVLLYIDLLRDMSLVICFPIVNAVDLNQ